MNDAAALPGPEYSIIIPTFNESQNVGVLVAKIIAAMPDQNWEIIFVDDDSPDGTADFVQALSRDDHRIRCIKRLGRRGLASACIEGILSSAARYVAVMDADLQHDETLLPRLFDAIRNQDFDIAVGSRYIGSGGTGEWNPLRVKISKITSWLARTVLRVEVRDPMSGFFALRRDAFDLCVRNLSNDGFKILVDIFASYPGKLRFIEIHYIFRNRQFGVSKLDARVSLDYIQLLIDKTIGQFIPVRFVMFGCVGLLGVAINVSMLYFIIHFFQITFYRAQIISSFLTIGFNYILNNTFTYRDRKRRGTSLIYGFFSFAMICSVGILANIGVSELIFQQNHTWLMAGCAGAMMGAVWNYALASTFTWAPKKQMSVELRRP